MFKLLLLTDCDLQHKILSMWNDNEQNDDSFIYRDQLLTNWHIVPEDYFTIEHRLAIEAPLCTYDGWICWFHDRPRPK